MHLASDYIHPYKDASGRPSHFRVRIAPPRSPNSVPKPLDLSDLLPDCYIDFALLLLALAKIHTHLTGYLLASVELRGGREHERAHNATAFPPYRAGRRAAVGGPRR
jgi:hypothetical protein